MKEYHRCPKCNRVLLRVVFQGHIINYRKQLIGVNTTQLKCLRCNLTLDCLSGLSRIIKDWNIGIYNMYITSPAEINILITNEARVDGTDYLFKGDLA